MTTTWGLSGVALFFLLATAEFFSPILICVLSGNWWFMFLFFVSWIPALVTMVMAGILFD
jgi:hypothetical protein